MANAEWGPKNVPLDHRNLLPVTSFHGSTLREIELRAKTYSTEHPDSKRPILEGEKTARLEHAIDFLNQLGVVGRAAEDVENVVIKDDYGHLVKKEEAESRDRNGEGKPHRIYEIRWIREPEIKTTPTQAPVRIKVSENELRVVQQRAAKRKQTQADEERKAREQLRVKAEREAIENVVFDRISFRASQKLQSGRENQVRISLGPDKQAYIFHRASASRNTNEDFRQIDRNTGTYYDGTYLHYPTTLLSEELRYYEVEAQKLEGKNPHPYEPAKVNPTVIEDIYQRAINEGIISYGHMLQGTEVVTVVRFLSIIGYMLIDLESNSIKALSGEDFLPLNPQFAEFLRQKKAELDKS